MLLALWDLINLKRVKMHILGDTHSMRKTLMIIGEKGWTGQNIIHVGDFGVGFQEITRDIHDLLLIDEALMAEGNNLYVNRGNHDNPLFWSSSEKGLNLPTLNNIHFVDDEVRDIESKKILFLGGAISIDRTARKHDYPYPTWWKDEIFLFDGRLQDKINSINEIDVVISHTAPTFVHPTNDNVDIVNHYNMVEKAHGKDLKGELRAERESMDILYKYLEVNNKLPTYWYYGHFHHTKVTRKGNTKFKLLNINEVEELTD